MTCVACSREDAIDVEETKYYHGQKAWEVFCYKCDESWLVIAPTKQEALDYYHENY